METRGRILDWRFSLIETVMGILSFASLAVGVTLWSLATFQSKDEAAMASLQMDKRVGRLEEQNETMRNSMERMASDVSYIRGRIEPKGL